MHVRTFLGLGGLVGSVAYGCGGESLSSDRRGSPVSGSSGKAGAGPGINGGASSGARGGSGGARAGKGGSAGSGLGASGEGGGFVAGGATALGGTAGRSGGTGGDAPGGAGSDAGSCEVKLGWAGENTYDACCVGDAWDDTFEYYASEAETCGEPRTCEVIVPYLRCQDTPRGIRAASKCCADGRWHIVGGDSQLEFNITSSDLVGQQLSPPCGGTALPSYHALHFDGASYLDLPVSPRHPIFELWFRTSEASGPLLASTSTPRRLYLSGGQLCFSPAENGAALCSSEATLADGAWHHAAFSADSDDYWPDQHYGGLYADGTLRVAGKAQVLSASISAMRAGYGPVDDAGVSAYFVGDLDEIRIWHVERHPYDILDFYATRLTSEAMRNRMAGYFPLEGSGSLTSTENMALAIPLVDECSSVGGAGGAGPEPQDGALVGFSSVTSPWLAPGAF